MSLFYYKKLVNVLLLVILASCTSVPKIEKNNRSQFIGIWVGEHHDKNTNITKKWRQVRNANGTFSIKFINYSGVILTEIWVDHGKWWIDGNYYYEINDSSMTQPDKFKYEILDNENIKFTKIYNDESKDKDGSYEFVDTKLSDKVKLPGTEIGNLSKLPRVIGKFSREEIRFYDDKKMGVAANYKVEKDNSFAMLSVILFDAGVGPIADGLSDITKQAFDNVVINRSEMVQRGLYKNAKEYESKYIRLKIKHEVLFSQFDFTDPTEIGSRSDITQYIIMTGINNYVLKIIVSGSQKLIDDAYMLDLSSEIIGYLNS